MSFWFRLVAASVVVSLALAGPLAPVAVGQQPAPPAQTAPQPDLFQEALKATGQTAQGQPAPPGQPSYQPAPPPGQEALKTNGDERLDPEFYEVAANVATAALVPGRVATCLVGGAFGLTTLIITFGTAYRFATRMLEEGCGGKWAVTPQDLMPERTTLGTQMLESR